MGLSKIGIDMAGGDVVYYGIRRLADCDEGVLGDRILDKVGKYFLDKK